MIIQIKDIIVNNLSRIQSEPINIKCNFQFSNLKINNDSVDVLLVDNNTNETYIDIININKEATVKVVVAPNINTKSKNYKIILSNEKTSENIIIVGKIVVNSLVYAPIINIDSTTLCDPIHDGNTFKLELDQNKHSSCDFTFSCRDLVVSPGSVSDYKIISRNGAPVGSDITKLTSAIALAFTASGDTGTLSLDLSNPNSGGHRLDDYGFNNENEFVVNFDKTVTIGGTSYILTFLINITFKTSSVIITQKRIQTAIFDIYNTSTLISFDFSLSGNPSERQFSFGFDKTYGIPTRVGTIIPNALKFPFDTRYKPLQMFVLAQSIAKQSNYYSMKMIVEIQPPPNRSLVKQFTNVPFVLEYRGSRNSFNLPVKLQ